MAFYRELIEVTGRTLDAVGVGAVVVRAAIASVRFAARSKAWGSDRYRTYRQDLGRAILLGLES